ncbi:MAG TPA: UDP-N-acetylmuramoyl-tripeptide--D-alanyl-D-alanine ligase [Mycobacteriales bacterium]|nr:UDP-N-acetylmuramoyl-tripeptide--D-alanyl-D-alanine ligase [Mycobacteriales bacterium]
MIRLTLGELATLVDGRLAGAAADRTVTAPVTVDSREVTPGGLFAAYAGEHADGHDFAAAAVDAGAVAVLGTRAVEGAPTVVVADVTAALGSLARALLDRLPDLTVVGITGSAGKTTTKDLVAQVLGRLGPVIAPPGSFNNEIGLPLTVLRADETTRHLVLEYSARGVGHIRYLTGIAPPRVAAVLNVGSAHLGEFGSREAIAEAKGELVEALPADGVAVLSADDPLVAGMATRTRAPVTTFGEAATADVRADAVELDALARPRFRLHVDGDSADVALQLSGRHMVANALATAAVARRCGMPLGDVAQALSAARPASRWRMEVSDRPDGVTVINDAYNANPESARAAVDALVAIAGESRRSWAVLGLMAELGEAAAEAHRAVGDHAARAGVDRVVAVGQEAAGIRTGAGPAAVLVDDVAAAVRLLRRELRPGDVVLVKASRAAGLERIAAALLADADDGAREAAS